MLFYAKLCDKELLQLLVTGKEDAFTEIYNRYWKKLIALAYSHTKDKFTAEEVVQEVFLSLWNRKSVLQIETLNAYLATAVKFSIFKHIHSTARQSKLAEKILVKPLFDLPDETVSAKFLEEYINGIVEQLPEKCRIVYTYSRKQGLSIAEISTQMNIAEKTVEAHLTKALKVLRLNLKEILVLAIFLNKL